MPGIKKSRVKSKFNQNVGMIPFFRKTATGGKTPPVWLKLIGSLDSLYGFDNDLVGHKSYFNMFPSFSLSNHQTTNPLDLGIYKYCKTWITVSQATNW